MEEFGQAESLLGAALKLDNGCEVALYHLGLLYHRYTFSFSICFPNFLLIYIEFLVKKRIIQKQKVYLKFFSQRIPNIRMELSL